MATQAFGKRPGAAGRVGRAQVLPNGRTARLAKPPRDVVAPQHIAASNADDEASGGFSFKYFACFVFMLILLAAVVYLMGGALYRDFAHGSHFVADASIKVERADCKRTNFVLNDCEIDLSWMTPSGQKRQSAGFTVLFTSMAGTAVVPLRSSRDPEVVSTQAGLDHMTNRTITFMVFASILLALVVLGFKHTFRAAAPRKA